MPNILALDTATEACSVALWLDGEIVERLTEIPRGHAELILPMVDELMASAGIGTAALDAIAVTRGPGAFTGVRIGVSVAQGLAFGLGIPILPVSTLAALAMGASRQARDAGANACLAVLDARMGELYIGGFSLVDGGIETLVAESLVSPSMLNDNMLSGYQWFGVGRGWSLLEGLAASPLVRGTSADALPQASNVARLGALMFARGEGVAAESFEPVYLRDKVTS